MSAFTTLHIVPSGMSEWIPGREEICDLAEWMGVLVVQSLYVYSVPRRAYSDEDMYAHAVLRRSDWNTGIGETLDVISALGAVYAHMSLCESPRTQALWESLWAIPEEIGGPFQPFMCSIDIGPFEIESPWRMEVTGTHSFGLGLSGDGVPFSIDEYVNHAYSDPELGKILEHLEGTMAPKTWSIVLSSSY